MALGSTKELDSWASQHSMLVKQRCKCSSGIAAWISRPFSWSVALEEKT